VDPRRAADAAVAKNGVRPHLARVQRALIVLGVVILVVGIAWPWLAKLGLGRLPGDIRIETESGDFYFPIVTCLIISVVLSLLLWFFRR